MIVEFVGKFYDNHSLSIINRNIATRLAKKLNIYITPLDTYDPAYGLDNKIVEDIKKLEAKDLGDQTLIFKLGTPILLYGIGLPTKYESNLYPTLGIPEGSI